MGSAWGERRGGHGDPRDDRIEELSTHVRELDAQLRARSGSGDTSPDTSKLTARLADRVEVLAQRVDTLADIARSASSGVVARERELAAIRGEVGDARARLESAIVEFQRTDRAPVEALQRRIAMLTDDVTALQESRDSVTEKLHSVGSSADSTRSTITAHERALAELTGEVDALSARMDSVVVVVRQAVESILAQVHSSDEPLSGHADESTRIRIDELTGKVEALAAGASAFAERERELVEAQRRLEARMEELAAKLGSHDARPRLVSETGGTIATFGGGR